jgi:hypothetical protein
MDMDEVAEPDSGTPTMAHRMPRWVKAFLIVGVVLLIALVVHAVSGRGEHGPSRHGASARAWEVVSAAHTPAFGGG